MTTELKVDVTCPFVTDSFPDPSTESDQPTDATLTAVSVGVVGLLVVVVIMVAIATAVIAIVIRRKQSCYK